MRSPARRLRRVLLAGALALAAGGASMAPESPAGGPGLLVPARPDSAPPESPPGPLLIPGRPTAADSARRSAAERAREAYALGRQLERDGHGGPAIVSYRTALRLDPTLPDANYRMAMLFLARDQVAEAVKCLVAELEAHPRNVEASRELGLCYARFGDHPRAIGHLERLSREQPKDASVWHALGSVYLAAGRPRDAETALRRSLRLAPPTAEALRDLGATLAALGREGEARIHYRRAVSLDPADAASWLDLGNLERRHARPDSALALYRCAEAADSGFAPALEAQAQLLRDARRDAEAVEVYRRWLRRHPDHHGARLEAIRLLDGMDRGDDALALALEGAQEAPESGQSYLILGMVLRGRGDTRGAMGALQRAERQFAGNPAERARVAGIIAAIRASASDSLRALFAADSLAAARGPRR